MKMLLLLLLSAAAEAGRLTLPAKLQDSTHGVRMGVPSDGCDDGKVGLETDWAGSPTPYTCFLPYKRRLPVLDSLPSRRHCDSLPSDYYPQHYCMNHPLRYNETVPTHGDHRPLWPVFGEYLYVPPQRWLHNIEHGAVVVLYHPCADYQEVEKLRQLVRGCIRKHVITPYPQLSAERPLALVAWGCRLEMSAVDAAEVRRFVKAHALHGPEGTYSKQGQYDFKLVRRAEAPPGSDVNDSVLCPSPARGHFSRERP